MMSDERSRRAIEATEEYADGQISKDELSAAQGKAGCALRTFTPYSRSGAAAEAAKEVARPTDRTTTLAEAVMLGVGCALAAQVMGAGYTLIRGSDEAFLLREVFGNPFRPIAFDPAWLTDAVKALAQMIYDERRFDELPILADALEEADCTSADILSHCRALGTHVRGCWVVDLLLGRE
jgi:hypothetical protein